MELYKYTGSVAALTVRFGKAETITLYDSYDDSVPSGKALKTVVPAKVLTQARSNPDELVCFGCPDFINTTKPVSMGPDDYQNFLMWKRENRD